MIKVLIVDDSPVDRQMAGKLLASRTIAVDLEHPEGVEPVYASNGREALDMIKREKPDAVLTDMQMPEMDGLELVLQIREKYPLTPVIVMTAHGSEEVAVQALRSGAASYVPKRKLAKDLSETVESVLAAAQAKRAHRDLMGCVTQTESQFRLENDPAFIPPLVGRLKDSFWDITSCDDTTVLRLSIALREAILNAMDHGNLELDSALREQDGSAYEKLADQRRRQAPYKDRRVHITARETPREAVYIIRDEGPGFDPSALPDPTDPANMEKVSGRGLLLVRTFMTEVRHNDRGNEITMIRRVERGPGKTSPKKN
ncbi:MAG TPA: response regulator [Gemmataceae bacterium]|nr:response regulator [Gemmataceae bacterium]